VLLVYSKSTIIPMIHRSCERAGFRLIFDNLLEPLMVDTEIWNKSRMAAMDTVSPWATLEDFIGQYHSGSGGVQCCLEAHNKGPDA
jgi:hypothetical protein